MKVTCSKCGADYDVHADRVPAEGIDMKCSKCLHTFKVYPHGAGGPDQGAAPGTELNLKGVTFLGGQTAASQPAGDSGERFFIQRRSGKVFGPFEKRLIVQMLKARKLTGEESVSRDKAFWVPLAAIPEFGSALGLEEDVRNQTMIPGRPGPVFDDSEARATFEGRPVDPRSNFDISNLPGLGNEIDLGDAELPAPAGFGAELPAPAGFGAELPAPAGFGAELPAPAGFGAELPAPAGFGAELPAPAGFGAELPAPAGFGAELPAPAGFGAELPAPAGFGAELPAPAGFGAELPAPAGFGAELPAPSGFGSELPAPAGFGSELPTPAGFGAELPMPSGFGSELPAPTGFGAELPAPTGFGSELPKLSNTGAQMPAPAGFGAELPAPLGFTDTSSGFNSATEVDLPAPVTRGGGSPMGMTGGGFDAAELPAAVGGGNTFGGFGSPSRSTRGGQSTLGAALGDGEDLFDDDGEGMGDFGGFDSFSGDSAGISSGGFGPASFTVELDQSGPGSAPSFGHAPSSDFGQAPSYDQAEDELPMEEEPPELPPETEQPQGQAAAGKKPARKGRRVAAPLAIAIGMLAIALVIVVGLILTQTGLLGGGDPDPNAGNTQKKPVEVVKPTSDGADFSQIEADTHAAYQSYIEQTRKDLGARPEDVVLKSQLVVAYTLYLTHYPEDQQYKQEAEKLGAEIAGAEQKEAALARGALALLAGDVKKAAELLEPIAEGKEYTYTANLLLGISPLMLKSVPKGPAKGAEAPAEEGEEKPAEEAPSKDEEAAGEEGEEKPAEEQGGDEEAPAEGDEEAPAEGDGDVAEGDEEAPAQGGEVEMDLVDEVIAEEKKVMGMREKALSHLKAANKVRPDAPAPRFFAARIERKVGDTAAARAFLKSALAKAPEHIPGLLEMSMLSYLNGDLDEARTYSAPVTEKLSASASKRERSQAHLMLGLVSVARRQSEDAVASLIESLKVDPSNTEALKALGEEFFRNRKFEEALNYFTTNQELSQQDPEVMLGIVKSHIGLDQLKEATQRLELGVKTFPTDARFPFFLGLIHEREGHWPEARRRYRAALQIDPDFSKSRVRLALLLLRDNKRDEARELLADAEQRGAASDADIAVDIGQAYMLMGEKDRALGALQTALKLNASNLDARIRLARYHLDQGDSAKALELLQPFMESKGLDIELSLLLGDVFRAEKQYERSIEQYDRLIEADPKNASYIFKRGLAYFDWENFDTAQEQFLKAYTLDPKFTDAYFYAGRVELEEKDYGQAMKIFRASLDEDQSNGEYRYFLAYALEKNDNDTQALEEYKQVERFDPNYGQRRPELYYRRGRLLAKQGNYRLAKKDLASALKYDPKHLGALLALADTLRDEGDCEDAIKLYEQALEQRDDLAIAHRHKGQCHFSLKQREEGIRESERAIELGHQEAFLHEQLGYQYRDTGNRARALTHFRRTLELAPKAPNKKEIERQIRLLGGR